MLKTLPLKDPSLFDWGGSRDGSKGGDGVAFGFGFGHIRLWPGFLFGTLLRRNQFSSSLLFIV